MESIGAISYQPSTAINGRTGYARPASVARDRASSADTVSISAEALQLALSMQGKTQTAQYGITQEVKDWCANPTSNIFKENTRSNMLPENYDMLRKIEQEIASGNTSDEILDKQFLLTEFGHTRVLSEEELNAGIEALNTHHPLRKPNPSFDDIAKFLKPTPQLSDSELAAVWKNAEADNARAEEQHMKWQQRQSEASDSLMDLL